MDRGAAIARARAVLGARFRFQGRDADGLDCVGLVAHAYQQTDIPCDYTLRSADIGRWSACLDARFNRCHRPLEPGDVLMMQAGPALLHLGLWAGASLIHADGRLRCIVETPGPPGWPILGQWQMRKES